MKRQLLSLACSMSLLGLVTLPSYARTSASKESHPILQSQPISQDQPITQDISLPQSTAIVISFPLAVNVDVGQHKDYPLTVPLAQAIKDRQGHVLVPENTPVSIVLNPSEGGAKIVAKSMVINSQVVAIQASSQVIPGTTVTQMRANDKAKENGAVWGRIGGSLAGFLSGGDPDKFDHGAMGGSLLGLFTGLRSAENTRVVQIPQSGVYVLTLESPVSMTTP